MRWLRFAILPFLGVAVIRAEPLPLVKVKVEIQSDEASGLVDVPATEKLAAERIVAGIRQQNDLSFVRWAPEATGGDAAARFTVVLFEEKRRDLPSVHHIRYWRTIFASDTDRRPYPLDYAAGEPFFTTRTERETLGKSAELAEAIAAITQRHLSQKHELFLKQFLYKVPLSRSAPEFEADGSVTVGVPWTQMGATENSVLAIRIEARPAHKGTVEVSGIVPCTECPTAAARATVRGYTCPGVPTVDDLVRIIVASLTRSVVYMSTYYPSYEPTMDDYSD